MHVVMTDIWRCFLGLTDFITKHIEDLIYNVVLIYQPSEEISGGAQSVIQSGLLDKYEVQAIFGFHLWPGLAKEKFSLDQDL